MSISSLNHFILKHVRAIEMIAVMMRIISFSLLSWYGRHCPLVFMWVLNTIDAVMLSWCAVLRKDRAYTLLNVFWIFLGVVGIYRAWNDVPVTP